MFFFSKKNTIAFKNGKGQKMKIEKDGKMKKAEKQQQKSLRNNTLTLLRQKQQKK